MTNNNNEDKVSKGGFNFTFIYTNEKTYGEYVEECFKNVDIAELIEVEKKDQAKDSIFIRIIRQVLVGLILLSRTLVIKHMRT
ncbi:hypothetical protein ABE65_010235 [Fictibacillus phosphorivorans]|uniref:Uncharacterized protein n=1 Tax=Fictibacillus phosphorivorans TaxID=1221500 RepID=A0A160IME1_9BACL|nr:hypothetical protein [Fictibacillus phosphorivorans]ANC77157.1 hypothetical protein ABE65_010235 [Fictibacillus phosphorivorans]